MEKLLSWVLTSYSHSRGRHRAFVFDRGVGGILLAGVGQRELSLRLVPTGMHFAMVLELKQLMLTG